MFSTFANLAKSLFRKGNPKMDDIANDAVTGTAQAAAMSDAAIQTLNASDFSDPAPAQPPTTPAPAVTPLDVKLKNIFTALDVAIPACWDEVVALAKKV